MCIFLYNCYFYMPIFLNFFSVNVTGIVTGNITGKS
jgi:hypothetical protein